MVMMNLLTKLKKDTQPKKRYIYAVTGGKYLGELLVFMEQRGDDAVFLTLPDMKNRNIPVAKFNFGVKENIVEVVEKLPRAVYNVCKLQYKKNMENNVVCD